MRTLALGVCNGAECLHVSAKIEQKKSYTDSRRDDVDDDDDGFLIFVCVQTLLMSQYLAWILQQRTSTTTTTDTWRFADNDDDDGVCVWLGVSSLWLWRLGCDFNMQRCEMTAI